MLRMGYEFESHTALRYEVNPPLKDLSQKKPFVCSASSSEQGERA